MTEVQPQVSIYEREVDDDALEAALEARQNLKVEKLELNRKFKESDARVKTLLEALELGQGSTVRIGRFLVSSKPVPPREVAFTTDPTNRLQISLLPE